MKKSLFLTVTLFLFFCVHSIQAQNTQARKGQTYSFVAVGLVPTYLMDGGKIVMLPMSFGGDQMIADNISIGMQAGYSVSESQKEYLQTEALKRYRNSSYFTAFRFAVHCTKIRDWDIYGGYQLGLNLVKMEVIDGRFGEEEHHAGIKPKDTRITYTGMLGVRYGCCSNIGVFAELGFGASLFKMGMTYRL